MNIFNYFIDFYKDRAGGVSIEFVVIFPLLLLIMLAISFISLLIATASDVQQITHEMARASFKYLDDDSVSDICKELRTSMLQPFLDSSALLVGKKFTLHPCPDQPGANGFVTITATYDFAGSLVQSLGTSLNVDLGLITRTSRIMP